MTSFLQSQQWADFQKSVGRKVFDVEGTKVIKHELPFGKNYLYVPYAFSLPDLRDLAKQEKSIFVKVEPLQDDLARALIHQGYKKSSKTIQPHKTVVLDLTQSSEELLGAMHNKTRYNIRVAERNGVRIMSTSDVDIFWELMEKTTARDQFSSYPKAYYEKLLKLCKLYIAWHGEIAVAGAMILEYGDRAYYLHGASDYQYRYLMASYALHWEIIKSSKFQVPSSKFYDFWGIDAQKWPGITRFKLGWGGRVVEYPGAFDLVISKLWYYAYNVVHS